MKYGINTQKFRMAETPQQADKATKDLSKGLCTPRLGGGGGGGGGGGRGHRDTSLLKKKTIQRPAATVRSEL